MISKANAMAMAGRCGCRCRCATDSGPRTQPEHKHKHKHRLQMSPAANITGSGSSSGCSSCHYGCQSAGAAPSPSHLSLTLPQFRSVFFFVAFAVARYVPGYFLSNGQDYAAVCRQKIDGAAAGTPVARWQARCRALGRVFGQFKVGVTHHTLL